MVACARSRVHAVGERIDEQIQREIAENRKPDKPAEQMIIGIDGAFVKGRRPTDRASLEIITGLIETDAEQSKVFAVVRDQDGRAKQHVQAIARQRGRGPETKLRVVSDGEANKAQESFAEFVIPSSDSPVAFDFLEEVFYR